MAPWKNDVNVLIIFFVRDDVLAKTFEAVRQARPRRLLLWQDGAREGRSDDFAGIERCRKIVENIDWDCEVYKNYQTHNWGCDPSTFYSHKWAFSIVDKCIILEDDCCPSQSFFPFCKELLDRYENDTRINRICAMNNLGVSDNCPYDYFFTPLGSVWGWATWKRVADSWEDQYQFLEDTQYEQNELSKNPNNPSFLQYLNLARRHAATGKPYWESIQNFRKYTTSTYDIVPKLNMMKNTGVTEDATHFAADIKLMPKKIADMYMNVPIHDLEFPLKHPRYVIEDFTYRERLLKQKKINFLTKMEIFIRILLYGNPWQTLKKKFEKKDPNRSL